MFEQGIIDVFLTQPDAQTVWINEAGEWAWYARPSFTAYSREEVMKGASVDSQDAETSTSKSLKTSEAIEVMLSISDETELNAFIDGEKRKGVLKAYNERLNELKA